MKKMLFITLIFACTNSYGFLTQQEVERELYLRAIITARQNEYFRKKREFLEKCARFEAILGPNPFGIFYQPHTYPQDDDDIPNYISVKDLLMSEKRIQLEVKRNPSIQTHTVEFRDYCKKIAEALIQLDFLVELSLNGLDFSDTSPDIIENMLSNKPNLKRLTISRGSLAQFPNAIFSLEKLTELDLSKNYLESIPDHFSTTSTLKRIDLNMNQIAHLPLSICGLSSLEILNVCVNRLKVIPPEIGSLSNLSSLSASSNDLTQVPDNIGNLNQLRTLSLGCNKLKKVSQTFSGLSRLEFLDLNFNKIEEGDPVIAELIARKVNVMCEKQEK